LPTVCYDFEIDVIGVSVNLHKGKYIKIKSFYNPRGETDILDIFEKETVGGKALILGDFNVHSPLWEVTTYENKAGKV